MARAMMEMDGGSVAQKLIHPQRKASGRDPASLKYTYCPPSSGKALASSA